MGMPMVRRLLGARHDVNVFARRQAVREECAAAGANATADIRVAVNDADLVVVCLYAESQVRDVALGPEGFLAATPRGATLVVHTTGSPSMTAALAEEAVAREISIVEAPVSGSAEDVAAGKLTALLGGDPRDLEHVQEVLSAYCDPILRIGPLGSALTVKLLNNALCAAHLQLAGEVERITSSFGVDMERVAAAIQGSSGASYAMGVVRRLGSVSAVAVAAGHFLQKDGAVVEAIAEELHLDLGVLGYVNRHGPVTFLDRGGDDA